MLRQAGLAAALCALALPALGAVPPELLAAAQRLPPTALLDPVLRGAGCAFTDGVTHLGPLPAALAWTRPFAVSCNSITVCASLPCEIVA